MSNQYFADVSESTPSEISEDEYPEYKEIPDSDIPIKISDKKSILTSKYFYYGIVGLWTVTSMFLSLKYGSDTDYGLFKYFSFGEKQEQIMPSTTEHAEVITDLPVPKEEGMTIKISHLYVWLANVIFLISNVQMDILHLRLLMIVANIFLFLWGGFVLSTALDVLIYSSVNVLINIVFSIPLILARIPIKFDLELEGIYIKFFSSYLSRLEFQILLKK